MDVVAAGPLRSVQIRQACGVSPSFPRQTKRNGKAGCPFGDSASFSLNRAFWARARRTLRRPSTPQLKRSCSALPSRAWGFITRCCHKSVRPVGEYSAHESVFIDMKVRSYLLAIVAAASAFAFLATPAQAGGCRHRHHHSSCYQRDWNNSGYYQPEQYYQQPYYPSAQCYRPVYYYPAPVFQFGFCR
jgi:hypothetical protein